MPINEQTVLVTRPAPQAKQLCEQLTAEGFLPICYPTIGTQAVDEPTQATTTLQACHNSDYLIFVSANAVLQANLLLNNQWPKNDTIIVAIGPKTAEALRKIGLPATITADKPFSSEQLLEKFPDELSTKKGLIIKGEGGRTLLAEQLQQRGMSVSTVDVYKRVLPRNHDSRHLEVPHYITITSQLALDNLFILARLTANELKQHSTFVVFSQRIAHHAKNLGCQHIIICKEASDFGLISAITHAEKR